MRGSSHSPSGDTERKRGRTEENGKKYQSGLSVPDLSGHLLPQSSG